MTASQSTFVRFVITGGVTALAYLLLSLCFDVVVKNATFASLIAYAIVVFVHFALSNFFTFQERGIKLTTVVRYATFVAAFAVLNYVVAQLVRQFGLPNYALYVVNMVVSPLVSFVIMKSYVFAR